MQIIHRKIKTPLGTLNLYSSNNALVCTCFDKERDYWEKKLDLNYKTDSRSLIEIDEALEHYFAGSLYSLDKIKLNPAGTRFQKKVWRKLRAIKPGKTKSYLEIARSIGNPLASRAVGSACGANPLIIFIPCHRIIASSGKLGGFSAGLSNKEWLLNHEGRGKP